MKKDTTTNNEELNGSTFNSGKCKGLDALWGFRLLIASYENKWSKNVSDDYDKRADTIEKELKALEEIVALHNKWLGNEMSDFEFFTLLSEIKDKYGLQ